MPFEFIGESATLSGDGSDELKMEYPNNGNLIGVMVNSTGRFELTKLRLQSGQDLLTGTLEGEQLKRKGNYFAFPENISYKAGTKILVGISDFSGSSNEVYVAFLLSY